MATLLRYCLSAILCGSAVLICCAEDTPSRVVALGGYVSIELPAGWEVVEAERKCLVGPRGAPFVHLGYFRLAPAKDATADKAFAKLFVQDNLKVTKTDELPGGLVVGHAIDGASHQWNVATPVDEHRLAVLLVGMEVAAPNTEDIVATVDRLARSAQFLSPK